MYQDHLLWLKPNVLFVQICEKSPEGKTITRSLVVDLNNNTHYTPQNDSAQAVLDLLARENGRHFHDLKAKVLGRYRVDAQTAEDQISAFLEQLESHGILGKTQALPHTLTVFREAGSEEWTAPEITAGGSTAVVTRVIVPYRG
jgi:predicted deacylase|uniref:PqqD family protein n=1 Tax=Desulfobacca acetoxidans TaxID=60893 RepID=A0A7C5ALJ2_9BACT